MSEPRNVENTSCRNARTLDELLAVSKSLVERAAAASAELDSIAAELQATREEIERRLKERGETTH